jgi:hypothetical protein
MRGLLVGLDVESERTCVDHGLIGSSDGATQPRWSC